MKKIEIVPNRSEFSRVAGRRWTNAEEASLGRAYFAGLPGTCPICQRTVSMQLSEGGGVRWLILLCRGCGNSGKVDCRDVERARRR